jgi:hypothetical protein
VTKRKLQHFAENATFPHFFQPDYKTLKTAFFLKGRWNKDFLRTMLQLFLS